MKTGTRQIATVAVLILGAMALCAVAAPPVFESVYKKRVLCNALFTLEIWASDPQGYPMSFSISNQPSSAIFTPHSIGGVLNYVPAVEEIGMTFTCRFYAVSAGGAAEMPVAIQVVGTEAELTPYRLQRDVVDACGGRAETASYRSETAGGQGQPVGWTAGGIWVNSGGFHVPDAVAVTNRLIIATAADRGSISPSGTVWVADGSSQVFSITPDEYYFISDLEVDGASVGATNSYEFAAVTSNRTIHAQFEASCTSQGVPWWWLASHGLTNQPWEEAAALNQGCGRPAWEAWVAGTDPTNPATDFQVTEAWREVERMRVTVRTVPGRIYTFHGTTNLIETAWQPTEYGLTAGGGLTNGSLTATGSECTIYVPQDGRLFFVRPAVQRPED